MPDIEIARMDLARGLKPKNLVVPPMLATVVLKNPSADLQKAIKNDDKIVQALQMAAFEKLNKAREAVAGAIEDIDARYAKDPPADKAEAEKRAATLSAMCKKVAEAQGDAATSAAEAAWAVQVKKNKDLTKLNAVFGIKMALGTISVAASVVAAVLSVGTLAVTLLGAAKTVAIMASDIYTFVRAMDKTEGEIIDTDLALSKSWTDDKLTAGKVGEELAAALGAPGVKSIGKLDTLLDEYNAKNDEKDKLAEQLWKEAKKLMATIEKAPDQVSAEQKTLLAQAGKHADDLLERIGKLSKLSASNDLFYKTYRARLAVYQAMEGKALPKVVAGSKGAVLVAGLATTANTLVDVVTKLA